jgi:ATP:dephospho-CoA triphosphoribosyl transferase
VRVPDQVKTGKAKVTLSLPGWRDANVDSVPFELAVSAPDGNAAHPAVEKALSPKELEQLWDDLGCSDARKAYRAIRELARHPRQGVPLLTTRLRPGPSGDPARTAQLITDLDSDRFAAREQASEGLKKLGADAEPALRRALAANPSAEARQRVEALLNALAESPPPEVLRALRAIEVLEWTGTPEATRTLRILASVFPARVAREAEQAVARLRKKQAGR